MSDSLQCFFVVVVERMDDRFEDIEPNESEEPPAKKIYRPPPSNKPRPKTPAPTPGKSLFLDWSWTI